MATYYSAFFSSGLLASTNDPFARPQTPPDANTPRSNAAPLPDSQTTPTAPFTHPSLLDNHSIPSAQSATSSGAPVLRRRRSSITLGASPMTSIKSRGSAAVSSAQKHLSLSSQGSLRSRARAGSLHESVFSRVSVTAPGDVTETKGLVGRLRSGSIGTALR